jgi:hypothetical protein
MEDHPPWSGRLYPRGRQFTEAKAKEHARAVAMKYVHDEKREDLPELENLDWQPFAPGEFLN